MLIGERNFSPQTVGVRKQRLFLVTYSVGQQRRKLPGSKFKHCLIGKPISANPTC